MELHIERGAALELRQGRRERAGGTGAPLCTRPGESEAAVWPKWAEEIPLPLPLSVPACGCARIDVSCYRVGLVSRPARASSMAVLFRGPTRASAVLVEGCQAFENNSGRRISAVIADPALPQTSWNRYVP